MKGIVVGLMLILTPSTVFGEVPESIIGTWHFDLVRTMSEHIDRVAQARPDMISLEYAAAQKVAMAELAKQSKPQVTMTFTKDTVTSTNLDSRPIKMRYSVIGGNSRLIIAQTIDDEGYGSVVNIRLVENGIAIEPTNCREQPEQCERERRRAMEHFSKTHGDDPTAVQGDSSVTFLAANSDEPTLDGLETSPPHDDISQPRWIYFKRADEE